MGLSHSSTRSSTLVEFLCALTVTGVLFVLGCDPTGINPSDDLDNDGVTNARDVCPDSLAGEPVDLDGCDLTQRNHDGPIADDIAGKLGTPVPSATADQLATFERGREVFNKQFALSDGLGPAFNVTFCGACHEKPVIGGSAGLYRNFFLAGRETEDGAFLFTESAGMAGGVVRLYDYDPAMPARPEVPETTTVFAQRNPIPFFGMGLIAELPEEEILARVDENDADGDGISGRANFDRGFVGRFGRKSQTVSLEGFIRGPLFNHLGITTDPLTDDMRAQLPVDSSAQEMQKAVAKVAFDGKAGPHMQAAAPDGPNFDNDGAADPEMSVEELFDLVSFQMLMAAPELETLSDEANRGRMSFHQVGCSACHVPRLTGPRGPIPVYSDLLLHDMGPELADGIRQGDASGSEFRTQPLWGISAVGPYLHDGRADTLEAAVLAHGGEAQAARDNFAALSEEKQDQVVEFLLALGGRDQFSGGLLPPDAEVPDVGEYGGPLHELNDEEMAQFERGRSMFDFEFGHDFGVGAMAGAARDNGARFNGDSCRACHFQPTIGGAGPRGVNVMRHGILSDAGFTAPSDTPNTILHREIRVGHDSPVPEPDVNVFEHRQTPAVFGVGMIDAITEETILSNADPDDLDEDGISGRAHVLSDGRVGRFGWKAQVPSTAEFARDALAAEMGITLPPQEGMTFGILEDDDGIADPEGSLSLAADITMFMNMLAPPPRQEAGDAAQVAAGEAVFATVGCSRCHIQSLPSPEGDVPLYSDLLLHEILPAGSAGIVDGDAGMLEFRTAPLWGISQTAPYLHSGAADTIDEAIRMHDGEAVNVRTAYENLSDEDRAALLAFLQTL